jgi:hypothetical protein
MGHLADTKFAYPSFEAVMSHLDEIRSSFSIGALEIAKRMSEQIADSAKHPGAALAKEAP